MTASSTRPIGRLVALLLLLLGALLAVGAFVRWQGQLRPAGHVEVVLEPLAPHPLEPGRFVYELRVLGVSRAGADDLARAGAFRVRTRRGEEWSDVAAVTTSTHPFALQDGAAKRLPDALTVTVALDRWGNEVERFAGASYHVRGWRAGAGLTGITWETGLVVGDAQPEELEVSGALEAADGAPLPFVKRALVPERRITGAPTIVLHPDSR